MSTKRTHDGSDAGQDPKQARRRTAVACEECRARKKRCDGATPSCGACSSRKIACIYASELQSREWQLSMLKLLQDSLEKADGGAASSVSVPLRTCPSDQDTVPAPTSCQHPAITVSGRLRQRHSQDALSSPASDVTVATMPPQAGVLPHKGKADRSENLDQVIDDISAQLSTPTWSDTKFADPGRILSRCTCSSTFNGQRQWHLPLRRHADALLDIYFSTAHFASPILHEEDFRRQYAQLWSPDSEGDNSDALVCSGLCKQESKGQLLVPSLFAVFATASLLGPSTPDRNVQEANTFFSTAEAFDFFNILDGKIGLELIQLLLLMARYLQSTERFVKCRNISALAIQLAQTMGLHYSVAEAQAQGLLALCITQREREMRSRVWCGCVLLEREIPMYLCPSGLLVKPVDQEQLELPKAIDDVLLSDRQGIDGKQPEGVPSLLEAYVYNIKLHNISGRAFGDKGSRHSTRATVTSSVHSLLGLEKDLVEWRSSLPVYLQHDRTSTQTDPHPPPFEKQAQKLFLRYLNTRHLILRPALEVVFKQQQRGNHSSKGQCLEDVVMYKFATECILAARLVIEMLCSAIESRDLKAWWFNVAYLHTCGSTILMARFCKLDEPSLDAVSLMDLWTSCLECLKLYARFSSIAQISLRILGEGEVRLTNATRRIPESEARQNGGLTDISRRRLSLQNFEQRCLGEDTATNGGATSGEIPPAEKPLIRDTTLGDFYMTDHLASFPFLDELTLGFDDTLLSNAFDSFG